MWALLAVIAAFFNSSKNVLMKKVSGPLDPYSVGLGSLIVTLPVLWAAVALSGDFTIEPGFWLQMVLMLPFELAVTILWFKAVKDSELSSAFPFISFMPFFVAIGSFFLLDESFGNLLFAGLALLSVGGYILNKVNMKLDSFVFRGALYMFAASALWGYIIPMGKIAVEYSTAQLFPAIYFTLATILFTPVYFYKREYKFTTLFNHWHIFLGIGLLNGLYFIFNWAAYGAGNVSGVAALSQLAVLFTVLIGGAYFKERKLLIKIVASLLMLIGAVLIIYTAG